MHAITPNNISTKLQEYYLRICTMKKELSLFLEDHYVAQDYEEVGYNSASAGSLSDFVSKFSHEANELGIVAENLIDSVHPIISDMEDNEYGEYRKNEDYMWSCYNGSRM